MQSNLQRDNLVYKKKKKKKKINKKKIKKIIKKQTNKRNVMIQFLNFFF